MTRSFPGALIAAAGLLTAAAPGANAGITSGGSIAPSNYYGFQPPAAGGAYVDPAFGSTIKRLSNAPGTADAANGGTLPWILNEYSTPALWNTPNSLFLLNHGSYFAIYDGNGNYLRDAPLDMHASTEPRWSRTNASVIYYKRGNAVKAYNVSTNVISVVRTFSEYGAISGRGKADQGFNSNKMVLSGDTTSIFVYDADTNTKSAVFNTGGNGYESLNITADDQVAIGWNANGAGRYRGIELFDGNMNFLRQVAQATGHMDHGRDLNGDAVLVWTNSNDPAAICNNGIVKIRLATGQQTCLLELDWSLAVHISAGDQGWAVVSTYAPGDPNPAGFWPPYTNEVFRIRLDGAVVERLAHHRSRPFNSYNWMSKASLNRDGTRIVYSSNYGLSYGGEYGDSYLINLGGSAPPPPPTGAPTATPTPAPTVTPTPLPGVKVEQNHSSVVYAGTWTTQAKDVHSGGSAAYTKQAGAEVSLSFTGTGIVWRGSRDPWAGQAQVYLDGALKTTVDAYSAAEANQDVLYSASGLGSGPHVLRVRVTGTMNASSGEALVWADAFEIFGGGPTVPTATPTPAGPTPTPWPPPAPGTEKAVVWTKGVGVAASGNSLSKTAAEGWNAGAVSVRSLASGDGYVRFTASERDKGRMVGLGNGDAGQSYVDVEYGLLLRGDALLAIYEAGVFRGMFGGYATGDVLQVGVESGVVRYRKNGALLYSSPTAPSYPLVVDTALYHQGSTVSNAVLGGNLASNAVPVAKAGGPYRWTAGRNIRFDGTGSSDDGNIVSYAWDFGDGTTGTGATPAHAYSSAGSYTARLTVTDNDGSTAAASASVTVDALALEKAVSWTSAVGVAAAGNSLSKTAPDGWNAGAVSTQSLRLGEGYAAVTAGETSLGRLFGLGNGNLNQSFSDVEYGILLRGDALVAIYESGMFRGVFGSYASGDVFRVGVEAGVVRYRKNGAPLYTSAIAPSYPLLLDTALYHSGSTLSAASFAGAPNSAPVANAGGSYRWPSGRAIRFDGGGSSDDGSIVSYAWSFGDGTTGSGVTPSHAYASAGSYTATLTVTDDLGVSATASASVTVESPATEQPVFWTNAVGVSVMGSNLSKVTAEGWGNGGAISTKSLSSGDGYVLFVAGEADKGRMVGLGRGNTDQSYTDVEYGLLLRGDGLIAIYEAGAFRGLFGSYASGDVLRVGVESGVVRYRRNGALLFTSPTTAAYPLLVDTAFYHAASTVSNAVIAGN